MPHLYLVTMPPSHFAEKARWALDMLGQPYVEESCAPPFHRGILKKLGAGPTVPALWVGNRTMYRESNDILEFVNGQVANEAKLFPPDPVQGPLVHDFCLRCDREFGPLGPRMVFAHLSRAKWVELVTQGTPEDQARKLKLLSPLVFWLFKMNFKIGPAYFAGTMQKIDKFYGVVDHLLDDGRRFLFCDRLTAADITFCSLAAPTLLVRDFGGAMLRLEDAPPELKTEVDRLRKTRVGTYVQAVYKMFRKAKLPTG